jgi:hypothetical protein
MHLVGHLSRPSPRLLSILDLSRDQVKRVANRAGTPKPTRRRLGNGVVQRAVIAVLEGTNGPMRTGQIQVEVERLLGHPVAKESVSWSLRTGSQGSKPRFECVAYGAYRLRCR